MAIEGEENAVVAWYTEHIGEPDRPVDVYLGFGLFCAGLALGLGGLALYLVEQGAVAEDAFWIREIAFSVGALGLPALLLGVVVLLPVDRRALYVGSAGAFVTLCALAVFVWAYPSDWNVARGPDHSATGVVVYAVGLVTVVASAGAALVSYHVERAGGGPSEGAESEESGPTVTDEDVRRDIEEATANTELTWGGVAKTRTQRLRFSTDEGDGGIQSTNMGDVQAKTVRSSGAGVDSAVAGLKGMKGDVDRTERSGGTDDQATALAELRKRQQAEAEAEPDGFVERLRSKLGV
jgi:hypothetical protein